MYMCCIYICVTIHLPIYLSIYYIYLLCLTYIYIHIYIYALCLGDSFIRSGPLCRQPKNGAFTAFTSPDKSTKSTTVGWDPDSVFANMITHPKDPGTLKWRGWNLYSRGPGSQNRHFWGVRILIGQMLHGMGIFTYMNEWLIFIAD